MARAGEILVATLEELEKRVKPGLSTKALDASAERFIRAHGGVPTFKGYRGFPGPICASPNAMIVHGIPGAYRLKDGDILSVDVGVTLDGWVAAAARTLAVGAGAPPAPTPLEGTAAARAAPPPPGGAAPGGGAGRARGRGRLNAAARRARGRGGLNVRLAEVPARAPRSAAAGTARARVDARIRDPARSAGRLWPALE